MVIKIVDILIVFLLKITNNCLATGKTISISKGKYLTGALFNGFSELFYLIVMVRVVKSSNIESILAMCLATFLGTYIPGIIVKKNERQKMFIFDITSDNLINGISFSDKVREQNIPIKTYKTYDNNMNKCLSCKIYCSTKEESRIINDLIPSNFKYNVSIPVE